MVSITKASSRPDERVVFYNAAPRPIFTLADDPAHGGCFTPTGRCVLPTANRLHPDLESGRRDTNIRSTIIEAALTGGSK
ncbi:hypothetical protein LCM4579_15350 [Ensifer sp. LCM 4579]|nr:hypothetical protein LCM4579_15350 [Ensifer sp. LCM 4579]